MVHGDDTGLVLPPRVAPTQIVVIPLHFKGSTEAVDAKAAEVAATLRQAGFRVELDDRPGYKPGFKYNHWEMRGVCIRIELGPRDIEAGKVCMRARAPSLYHQQRHLLLHVLITSRAAINRLFCAAAITEPRKPSILLTWSAPSVACWIRSKSTCSTRPRQSRRRALPRSPSGPSSFPASTRRRSASFLGATALLARR
jgi:hypothetical protein